MNPTKRHLKKIINKALELGAAEAAAIAADDIFVEPELARYCGENKCGGYAKSIHCPPHGMDPFEFQKMLKGYDHAIVFKIDVPTQKLLGNERQAEFRNLQTIAAQLEAYSISEGFGRSTAFAGGSCKEIFCPNEPCAGLSRFGNCIHGEFARASMSGLGVNVFRLMQTAGWAIEKITSETPPGAVPVGTLAGLVLIG